MSRVQLALNVNDIDEAVRFYTALFGTEPAKRKPGYANFAIAEPPLKLVLLENPGQGGTLNHLGVEVDVHHPVRVVLDEVPCAPVAPDSEQVRPHGAVEEHGVAGHTAVAALHDRTRSRTVRVRNGPDVVGPKGLGARPAGGRRDRVRLWSS